MLSKLRPTLRGLSFPTWSIPVALLVLALLSYGLRALGLGFYWDDFPYLWFFHRFGPTGIINAFEGDRPFLSFIYTTCLTIFGNSTQAWQIFAIFARWLCSLGLWWTFALAWPQHKNKAAWAVMLYTVYPGFTQQWIAVIYGQAFFLFSALFFSIAITLWLARNRQRLARGWVVGGTLLALALSYFNMFSTEYFFGLELLRPVLLWLVFTDQVGSHPQQPVDLRREHLQQARKVAARKVAVYWAPFLALMLVFIFWRAVIHPFTGHNLTTLTGLETSPLSELRYLTLTILQNFVVASVAAWGQALAQLSGFLEKDPTNDLRMLAIMLVTGILSFLYLRVTRADAAAPAEIMESPTRQPMRWGWQAILVGLFAYLVSGWPIWLTGLPMRMGFPWDRYSLAMEVGITLMLAGMVDILGGPSRSQRDLPRKAAVISLALALAVGFHYNTAQQFRQDWNAAEDFFWQLTWRAPAVQTNTLFASDGMPLLYYEDDSLSAPLNWTYDPNGSATQMPYILYDLSTRQLSMPPLVPGLPVVHGFRAANFSGTTDQVLAFSYNPPGCVHILDPIYDAQAYHLPNWVQRILPLSNPARLIQDSQHPATPPADIFGNEPKHRWCYFFEKAELARQKGDWKTIASLSKQSIGIGYRPEDASEYLPFIEAFNHLVLFEDSLQLTEEAYRADASQRPALCATWKRSYEAPGDPYGKYQAMVEKTLNCAIQ
ncbi:MAG TPA: hypothetical protein VF806_02750 [Anaerolineaceae bacterium]